mmetsp:Transcript_20790/g.32040  ORF Transcript_20790/g.32040 Transcript_20790/m.32040 type:complete len:136 (+) Transcript_20790:2915-3322(+)
MIGESDFVPIQAAGNGLVDPLKASVKRGDDKYYLRGNTSKLVLATENSDVKERIDFTPLNKNKLDESKGGITDTMDFIDRMLKKQELPPHEQDSPLNLKALHEPLEIPAYDGPQKSLLKKEEDEMVGMLTRGTAK